MRTSYTFDTAGYRHLLEDFLKAGYQAGAIDGLPEQDGILYLRHDVDFSPEAAMEMAKVETEVGVFAHYYFITTSPFYNLFDPAVRNCLKSIVEGGHKIGLHCDAAANGGLDLISQLRHEKATLESASGTACESFSYHRPPKDVLASEDAVDGMTSCYGESWFKGIKYCSDSTGAWRFGLPTDTNEFASKKSIQLLTHPIWWYLDTLESPEKRLQKFYETRCNQVLESIDMNSTVKVSGNAPNKGADRE